MANDSGAFDQVGATADPDRGDTFRTGHDHGTPQDRRRRVTTPIPGTNRRTPAFGLSEEDMSCKVSPMVDVRRLVDCICAAHEGIPRYRSMLVALSGIDGSGKGYVTARIADQLRRQEYSVASINIDGWLNLPGVRFNPADPARHFYHHAIRFDSMFSQLVLPLRDSRCVNVETDHAEETATEFTRRTSSFDDVDVVLLEGIYLLKPGFRAFYDLAIWIECSFETALERAIARAQEGLSPDATIAAYRTIYFPAQEIHFAEDNPRVAADLIFLNDHRLQLHA